MSKEIWKDVPNYVGFYQVSSLGRVKSLDRIIKNKANKSGLAKLKGVMLSTVLDKSTGYYKVNLSGKTKTVHQIMALSFLNHNTNSRSLVVDHIDNDKSNNTLSNLQIITARENTSKDRINGASKYVGVFFDKKLKKWRAAIRINKTRKYLGCFNCETKAHLAYQKELKELI